MEKFTIKTDITPEIAFQIGKVNMLKYLACKEGRITKEQLHKMWIEELDRLNDMSTGAVKVVENE